MKRMSALLLGLFVAAGLAGCGGNVMPNTASAVPSSTMGSMTSPTINVPPAGKDSPPNR
jgi:hypothetical protein